MSQNSSQKWSIRQSLAQLCCTGRASGSGPKGPQRVGLFGGEVPEKPRLLVKTFHRDGADLEPVSIAIEYECKGPDADAFDLAFRNNDLKSFVRLLESQQAILRLVEPKHPWAEDPRTVGALAAVQLASLASQVAKDDPNLKLEICEAGAISALVGYLESDKEDRVQVAVVALNYLTDECSSNAYAAFDAGAMPLLITHLNSSVAGMRGAAASTLRHICMESEDFCEAFVRLGGIRGFVDQLEPPMDQNLDNDDLMLEAVWNLEDVTTDQAGNMIEKYAKLAANEGAVEKLETLKHVGNEEVSSAADKVLAALAQVK